MGPRTWFTMWKTTSKQREALFSPLLKTNARCDPAAPFIAGGHPEAVDTRGRRGLWIAQSPTDAARLSSAALSLGLSSLAHHCFFPRNKAEFRPSRRLPAKPPTARGPRRPHVSPSPTPPPTPPPLESGFSLAEGDDSGSCLSSPGFHLQGCNLLHQLTATFAARQFWFSLFGQLGLANIKRGNLLEAQGGGNYLSPLERGLANQLYGYYRSDSALTNAP